MEGFSSYISKAIERSIINEIKGSNKHRYVLSMDAFMEDHDYDEYTLNKTEDDLLFNTAFSRIKTDILLEALNCLKPREKKLFQQGLV